jgi:hypothetical protein
MQRLGAQIATSYRLPQVGEGGQQADEGEGGLLTIHRVETFARRVARVNRVSAPCLAWCRVDVAVGRRKDAGRQRLVSSGSVLSPSRRYRCLVCLNRGVASRYSVAGHRWPSMAVFIVRPVPVVAGCLRHSRRCADLATSRHRAPRACGGDGAGKPALAVSHHEAEHQQHECQPPRRAVTASVRAVAAGALPDWQRPAFKRVENGYSSRQLLAGRVPNGWRGSQLDRASLALGCPTVSRRSRAGLDRIGAENVR